VAKRPRECKRCRGLGKLPCRNCIAYGGHYEKCKVCGGKRWVVCGSCNGEGVVR